MRGFSRELTANRSEDRAGGKGQNAATEKRFLFVQSTVTGTADAPKFRV
jgi:hypothetical protein